ncbi:MAG: glycosyltransferase family 4 protein [Kiritimatiellae bacterium]|jgi:glycosyltransferase involved in cell wall biosynthesis|nr:glycosyltransferase family 4 protein [Kiritimatiellia bacterium]MDD4342572.1 glycosyltransferase family 4 protein [Kiritimatiellia bacterium]MDY0149454.1 glycosyltransferase family 4 protein [Kiritimatiellia bacterium]
MAAAHPTRSLRVLFINRMACLERGGGETFDLEISRHVAQAGAQVTFLSGAPLFGPPPMPLEGAVVLHTPWLKTFPWDKVRGGWRVRQAEFEWFEWRAARWVARHAAEFDVIQVCELPNLVVWLKRRGVTIPVVMRLTAPNYYDPRGGVGMADGLIASGTTIEKLRDLGLDVENIPNAVDADRFRPQASNFRQQYGIGRDDFVALYVARFQAFKNHAMLLKAFARFTQDHPGSWLMLAGSGPLQERTQQQAIELKIADRVLFLGELPFSELPAVYAAADVKVISSDYESFCFAAIEAMATGLPVLTTDCAWVPRLVADGAGIVVPVGDPTALAAGLKKLAENPALRQRMGATGRQQVLERHTWPASAEKLMGLYQRLCKA